MSDTAEFRSGFSNYTTSILLLLGLNLTLASLKLTLGYLAASTALRSDGWNNTADFVYSLLLAAGLWISSKPPDESHPEGHDRFQSVMGFMVALIIMATGCYVLFDAYRAFLGSRETLIGTAEVAVVLASVVLKGALGWYLLHKGEQLNSPALRAIGWDQTGDILADLAVLFALIGTYFELYWLDPLVAALIGLLILRIGWEPFSENLGYLTGRAPEESLHPKIDPLIDESEHFTHLTNLRAHYVGPTLHVLVTVKAPGQIPLNDIHEAEETLRENILNLPDVSRAFIHVEPPQADSPQ